MKFTGLVAGLAVFAASSILVVALPTANDSHVMAQDKKAEAPKAITYKEAQDDKLVYRLAFGDQKALSKTIELSLKSKVIEENQGGLYLMGRLSHFEHSKLAVKFLDNADGLVMSLASIALLRCTHPGHLNDVFKLWDKLEADTADKSDKLKHFRMSLECINLSPEAIKLLLVRAKQKKLPDQAEAALTALKTLVATGKTMTLDEVEKHTRTPEFTKAMKLRATQHKSQSSSMPLFFSAWDYKKVRPACAANIGVPEGQQIIFATAGLERGEKQGFEVRFKVLLEKDDSNVAVRMVQPGAEGGIGVDITGKSRIAGADSTIQMQNTGRWVEFHFAWVPWRRADGTSAMGSINTEGFSGGGNYYESGTLAPEFYVTSTKGVAWVSPGEITRIDRLP